MPSARLVLRLVLPLLACWAGLLALPGVARAGPVRWRWPVAGAVVGAFRYSAGDPFARGQRRGIDVAAPAGARVGAACAGRVTFAGPVPGGGLAVTVRCGRLVATHIGLARAVVRRGASVGAGTRLGVVGRGGRLRLGARRADDPFGYVDPLDLLVADGPAPGRPLAPLGRAPRGPLAPARPRPRPRPRPVAVRPRPVPGARPAAVAQPRPAVPRAARAGLVLVAAGLPLGGLYRRSRRRRAGAAAVPAEGG